MLILVRYLFFCSSFNQRWRGTEIVFLQDLFTVRRQLLSSPPAALAVSQTFENSLYVRTGLVGLNQHMETSEGGPR